MAEFKIDIPATVGEKIYFYTVFKNKLFVLNANVAEIRTVTGKSGTSYTVVTNTGLQFSEKDANVLFFADSETAKATADSRIDEVNKANAKLGLTEKIVFGGVI